MAQDNDKGTDTPTHDIGTGKGEEAASRQGKEAGRHDTGKDEADRPTGIRTARDSTGINAKDKDPIDPSMPHMPPS
jgi:hypothetical protein